MATSDYHFQLAVKAEAFGKPIVNIFWYRLAWPEGTPSGAALVAVATALASLFKLHVWPAMRLLLPSFLTLKQFEILIYDHLFNKITPTPIISLQTGSGDVIEETDTLGTVVNVAFSLLQALGSGVNADYGPLKHSYLAIGPMPSGFVTSSGTINPANQTRFDEFASAITTPLVDLGGETFTPERATVRVNKATNTKVVHVSDVTGAVARQYGSFRRSRIKRK